MPNARANLRISVALCTHNGASFVVEQVASILGQSRPVDEIVLSDDASVDETVALVRSTVTGHNASAASPVELLVLRNPVALGVVGNFEQAVTAATGDLIALSDQDDIWHPDKVSALVDAFSADAPVALAFTDARLVDASGAPLPHSLFAVLGMTRREKRQLRDGRAFDALLGRNLVTGATAMFSRELLEVATPFAPDWVHDEWLAALAAATGGVRMLDAQLIDYRQHGANQIGASRLTLARGVERVTEGRTARNARLLARSRELVERLEKLGPAVSAPILADARAKLAHEELRSSLPAGRIRRVPAVARELLGGRYARYGRGVLDAGRDLIQPAR